MPRYFDPTCTVELLEKKIKEAAAKYEDGDGYGECQTLFYHHPQIQKDLGKVDFDAENFCEPSDQSFAGYGSFLGYHTLPNGMAYVGLSAGGDWQYPPCFIFYFDGKELRGYIPKNGNVWNYQTKEAIGNDYDKDAKFLKKILRQPPHNLSADETEVLESDDAGLLFKLDIIQQDIQARILAK